MSIKITSTNSERFSKIEDALIKLSDNFINKFEQAEYLLEGFYEIKLVSNYFYGDDEISLPSGFIIKQVETKECPYYKKDKDDIIIEDKKYEIQIDGTLNEQKYNLVYKNLNKPNVKIRA